MRSNTVAEKISLIILSLAGWSGLVLQAGSMIGATAENGIGLGETMIRFFSYFTILTNILVALSVTIPLISGQSKATRFFSSYRVRTALLVYIVTVGFIYMQLLQKLWNPEGLSWLADRILHYFIPIGYLVFWVFVVPKEKIPFRKIFFWLIYPLIYVVLILIRGAVSGFYPYPFLNVDKHGYKQVIETAGMMTLLFLFLSCLFWLAGRFLK